MSSLANAVRANVSEKCLTTRCQREGCKVRLPSSGRFPDRRRPFVVIDMDRSESPAPRDRQRCDFLFIGECKSRDWVVPIELKRTPKGGKILAQLQAGASIAEKIVPNDADVNFQPVAAYENRLSKHVRNTLRENKIRFCQERKNVRLIHCGASLEQALKSP